MEKRTNTRRTFIKKSSLALTTLVFPFPLTSFTKFNDMTNKNNFDAVIIGGSYAGLSAGMALGRALRNVLIIDNGKPCNSQTPHSHNFLTQDGKTPKEISTLAKEQVLKYKTIQFYDIFFSKNDTFLWNNISLILFNEISLKAIFKTY